MAIHVTVTNEIRTHSTPLKIGERGVVLASLSLALALTLSLHTCCPFCCVIIIPSCCCSKLCFRALTLSPPLVPPPERTQLPELNRSLKNPQICAAEEAVSSSDSSGPRPERACSLRLSSFWTASVSLLHPPPTFFFLAFSFETLGIGR